METKNCTTCGKTYDRKGQSKTWFANSKFCGKPCQSVGTKGDKNWRWIRRKPAHCKNCGKEVQFRAHVKNYLRTNRKFCSKKCQSGIHHQNWRGGRYAIGKGYIRSNTGIGKTNYEHRAIAEGILGRKLLRSETVHHINCDKTDNRPSNLLICTNQYHRWLHNEMSRRYAQQHFA